MPDIQEVFRMATQKVRPDPGSLDRQHRDQQRRTTSRKVTVYALVAALVAVVAIVALSTAKPGGTRPAGESTTPSLAQGLNRQDRIVVGLDGSTIQEISGLPNDAFAFSLSGDGGTIAFVTAPKGVNHVATIGMDGQGLRILGLGSQPAFSPDGARIAFVDTREGNQDIYVMNADGSGVTRLTTDPHGDEFPQWSPDGRTIVYDNLGKATPSSSGFSDTSVIMTIPASGGAPAKVSRGSQDSEPAYSPDGTMIAFRSHADIWVMNADGTRAHRIARNRAGTADAPQWSPDGTEIAFTDYTDIWRAELPLGSIQESLPIELVRVVNLATGRVTSVGHLGMATFFNRPQWIGNDSLLLNVARRTTN